MRARHTWLGLALLSGLTLSWDHPSIPVRLPAETDFVVRRGPDLFLHGDPFRFVGVNCYRLFEFADRSDDIFSTLAAHGVKVVRFWAFRPFCGPSGRDFAWLDSVVGAARRHDILLLPVLENHWIDCTRRSQVKSRDWYESGWHAEQSGSLSYRDYLRAIGERFRNEPQILAWQLMNEPEIEPDSAGNAAILRRFTVDAARELKRVDGNHLISLGLLGLGQPSTTCKHFRMLQKSKEIDFVSAHDHGYIFFAMPGRDDGSRDNSFYADLCDARALRKPFIATESGIPLSWVHGDRTRRADLFRAKLQAFFKAGGAGYLLWNYEPIPDTDHGFDADDPVMAVLGEIASSLHEQGNLRTVMN